MNYYKLLTQEMTSHNNTKWEVGVPIKISKEGNEMCSGSVLHCYNHPMLAVILNPIHANIKNPRLFEISVDRIVNSDGLKFASKSQTLLREISLPEISTEQKVEFGIRVVKTIFNEIEWNLWADKWLSGEDRSVETASTAGTAVYCSSTAAYFASASAAYYASADYYASVAYYASGATATAVNNASTYIVDKEEFNKKMIDIIEKIVKVEV